MNVILKRSLSGIVVIFTVAGSVLLSEYTMLLLLLVIFSISFKEFREAFRHDDLRLFILMLVSGQLMIVGFYLLFRGMLDPIAMVFTVITIFSLLLLCLVIFTTSFRELSSLFMGMIWIGGSVIFLMGTGWTGTREAYDPTLPMILIVLIWINDIAAYVFGTMIGKRPLAPRISPEKTIEGFSGGIILTSLAGWGVYKVTGTFSPLFWILTGAMMSLTATVGDLFESKLKREADVKDSGGLIPGHGGMLDRFDSTFFSAPFYFAIISAWYILT